MPWRSALAQVRAEASSEDESGTYWEEAAGNWLWLASPVPTGTALCIGDWNGAMLSSLARRYARVCAPEPRADIAAFAAARLGQEGVSNVHFVRSEPGRLPFRPGSFDCLALTAPDEFLSTTGFKELAFDAESVVREAASLLRANGCLYMAVANPRCGAEFLSRFHALAMGFGGRGSRGSRFSVRRFRQTLRRTGFRDIHEYYAEPSWRRPKRLVPRSRKATVALERHLRNHAGEGWLRLALASAGLHDLLYNSVIFLAFL